MLPQSEYPPDCDARRAYISGFDGSAGTVVVCENEALLWTDGRYFLQVCPVAGFQVMQLWLGGGGCCMYLMYPHGCWLLHPFLGCEADTQAKQEGA